MRHSGIGGDVIHGMFNSILKHLFPVYKFYIVHKWVMTTLHNVIGITQQYESLSWCYDHLHANNPYSPLFNMVQG